MCHIHISLSNITWKAEFGSKTWHSKPRVKHITCLPINPSSYAAKLIYLITQFKKLLNLLRRYTRKQIRHASLSLNTANMGMPINDKK